LVIGLALVVSWAAILAIAGRVRWIPNVNGNGPSACWEFLGFATLSCREELAFHGYPLRRLERTFGIWAAQLLIALAFVAEHRLGGMSWARAFLGPGVGSLLFGMAAIASDGLAVPIGLHAAWNIGHWTLGFKGDEGLWEVITASGKEERSELAAMTAYVVLMALAMFAFWLWNRRRQIA
jgi:membrane protease YdiL (CAAX protease family)